MYHSICLALGLVRGRSFQNLGSREVRKNHIGIDLMSRHQCAFVGVLLSERPTVSLESEHLCAFPNSSFQVKCFFLEVSCASLRHGSQRCQENWIERTNGPEGSQQNAGYLKYQASPKSKGDSEAKSKAAIALSTYQKLAPDQKAGFLKKFASNRRDLSWVGEIADVESNSTQTKTSCHEGYCNMAEIFST